MGNSCFGRSVHRVVRCTTIASCRLLVVIATVTIICGLALPVALQFLLNRGISSAIIWRPDSPPSVDARYRGSNSTTGTNDFVEIWLFNITNVDEIRKGKKPFLKPVGPFTYRKMKIKVNTWWDRDGRVAIQEYDYHLPVPERMQADLDGPIVTLNMPLIGAVERIHSAFGPAYQRLLDLLVSVIAGWRDGHVDGIFTTRTARELIWGYEDPLLQRLSRLLPRGMIQSTRVQLVQNMSGPEEALVAPPMVFDTGMRDIKKIWNAVSDGGHTEATCWNNCTERVRGSDGTQFHPGLTRADRLPVWVSALYRAEDFIFLQDVQWFGVDFLRFWPDPAASQPDQCHYQRINGLMNITIPKAVGIGGLGGDASGPPIYVSLPHFCMVDEEVAKAVDGLQCNMSRHITYVDIEPITGIPMRGHTSMMVSSEITLAARMHLEPLIAKSNNRSIVTPIFWVEENIYATEQDVQGFKDKVYSVLWYKKAIGSYCPAAGLGILLLSVVLQVALWSGRLGKEEPVAPTGQAGDDVERANGAQAGQAHGVLQHPGGRRSPAPDMTEPLLQQKPK